MPRPQGREGRLSDPFFLELLAGVGEAARERGCDLIISHLAPATYEDVAAAMTTSRADGVIFLGQSTLHAAFNRLVETEARFVVWGAELPDQLYCSIGSDNINGGRRATLHLARLGRRRIVFLGDIDPPESMQRHRGYLDALASAGLPVDPALIVDAHFEVELAEASVESLIRRGVAFDGVVCASDQIALGAVRALIHAGRRVPEDVSVIGFDNVPFSRYSSPALTHHRPGHDEGRPADGVQAAGPRRRRRRPLGARAHRPHRARELRRLIPRQPASLRSSTPPSGGRVPASPRLTLSMTA